MLQIKSILVYLNIKKEKEKEKEKRNKNLICKEAKKEIYTWTVYCSYQHKILHIS